MHNRLFTNSERACSASSSCPGCQREEETWIHLLRECEYAREVRISLQQPPNFFQQEERRWIKEHATDKAVADQDGIEKSTLFLTTIWAIWKARNKLPFGGRRAPPTVTAKIATTRAAERQFAKIRRKIIIPSRARPSEVWKPPPQPFVKLNCDGSVSNRGAAAGGITRDH